MQQRLEFPVEYWKRRVENPYKHNASDIIRCFGTVQHLEKEVLAA